MSQVTVSPEFAIVLPEELRDSLSIRPGQTLQVFEFEGRIELVPERSIAEMRGFLRGIDTKIDRDADRL